MRRGRRASPASDGTAVEGGRRAKRADSAVGLVEAALAALVLAVALAAIFQALGLSVRGTEQAAEEMVATQLASELVDFLAGLPVAELPDAREGPPAALGERVKRKVERMAIPPAYRALVAIEPVPAGPPVRMKRVLVTVRWSPSRAVKLARLRADEVGL